MALRTKNQEITKNQMMKKQLILLGGICFIIAVLSACASKNQKDYWGEKETPTPTPPPSAHNLKPRYIWIDAAANFPDFANSKEKIKRDLSLAKDAGFTDIVVDVRPTTGDVLFKTSVVDQVKFLYAWTDIGFTKIDRTATWDYLQAFIDEAHKQNLRIHAAINTFVGGNTINGGTGMLYRDPSKRTWGTSINTSGGILNVMDTNESTKFLNPANPEVQQFLFDLLKDLAKYNIDGIVLDRARYLNLQGDFSDISKKQFENFISTKIKNYPTDILPAGTNRLPNIYPTYLKKWLEFRVKTMHDFMKKAREAVKSVNPSIKFGVYVGGWYSTYYEVGVNWASPFFDTSEKFNWATSNYKNYGYATLMDQMLIGAYASPLRVYGHSEWTMQGFCSLAKTKIKNSCPLVVGGPDVGNWDTNNEATQAQENQAIINSVKACMDACDGYFLFDMIHLKKANQWQYAKEGIAKALNN